MSIFEKVALTQLILFFLWEFVWAFMREYPMWGKLVTAVSRFALLGTVIAWVWV